MEYLQIGQRVEYLRKVSDRSLFNKCERLNSQVHENVYLNRPLDLELRLEIDDVRTEIARRNLLDSEEYESAIFSAQRLGQEAAERFWIANPPPEEGGKRRRRFNSPHPSFLGLPLDPGTTRVDASLPISMTNEPR